MLTGTVIFLKYMISARLSRKLVGLLSAAVIVACGAVVVQVLRSEVPVQTVASTDWGLSFQTEGAPPIGNASADSLRAYNAYYVGDTAKPVIYLTFDAGYEIGDTPAILS